MLQSRSDSEAGTHTKMELSMLVLQGIHLHYADRTFTHCVEFSHLNFLDLFGCPGVAKLLGETCRT